MLTEKLSILIPFRCADRHRLLNLQRVVRYWQELFPTAEILIYEQDDESKLQGQLALPDDSILLLADGGAFNKSKLLNLAVGEASGEILIISDADIIVEAEGVHRSIAAVQQELQFVRPFENLYDLSKGQTEQFLRDDVLPEVRDSEYFENRNQFGEKLCLAGGIFVIRRSSYLDLGGFDERFLGWGGEDNAFSVEVQKGLSKSAILRKGIAWHLWHPRQDVSQSQDYQRNCRLLTGKIDKVVEPLNNPSEQK